MVQPRPRTTSPVAPLDIDTLLDQAERRGGDFGSWQFRTMPQPVDIGSKMRWATDEQLVTLAQHPETAPAAAAELSFRQSFKSQLAGMSVADLMALRSRALLMDETIPVVENQQGAGTERRQNWKGGQSIGRLIEAEIAARGSSAGLPPPPGPKPAQGGDSDALAALARMVAPQGALSPQSEARPETEPLASLAAVLASPVVLPTGPGLSPVAPGRPPAAPTATGRGAVTAAARPATPAATGLAATTEVLPELVAATMPALPTFPAGARASDGAARPAMAQRPVAPAGLADRRGTVGPGVQDFDYIAAGPAEPPASSGGWLIGSAAAAEPVKPRKLLIGRGKVVDNYDVELVPETVSLPVPGDRPEAPPEYMAREKVFSGGMRSGDWLTGPRGPLAGIEPPVKPVEPGNIDLFSRPQVRNADGSISTVRSASFNIDGLEVLLPTVSDDGRIMSDQEAIETYQQTGKHLGKFVSPAHATAYANWLHVQQDQLYRQPVATGRAESAVGTVAKDPLAQAIEAYEAENPFFTRQGQRLEAGTLGLGRDIATMGAVGAAQVYGRVSPYLDQIDAGATFDELNPPLSAGMSEDTRIVRNYYFASPIERQGMRDQLQSAVTASAIQAVDLGRQAAAIPRNPVVEATTKALNEERFSDAWRSFITDPLGFIGQIGVESAPRMIPGLALAPVTGPVAGFGVASAFGEYGNAIYQGLQDAGVDVTDGNAVRAAFSDPAVMRDVLSKARIRAAAIGGFDALSGGIASKTLVPQIGGRVGTGIANVGAQGVAQGTLGAAGEASAQVASGEDLRLGDVAAEFAGEFVGAPAEVAAATYAARRAERRAKLNTPVKPDASGSYNVALVPDIEEPAAQPEGGIQPGAGARPVAPEGTAPAAPGARPVAPDETAPQPPEQPAIGKFPLGDRRTITAQGISFPATFPDAAHAALYDYGLALERSMRGSKENLGARAAVLADHFRGFVENDKGSRNLKPGDINELALDYLEDVRDVGFVGRTKRGEDPFEAASVIDADLHLDYWQREGQFPYGRSGMPAAAPAAPAGAPSAQPSPTAPVPPAAAPAPSGAAGGAVSTAPMGEAFKPGPRPGTEYRVSFSGVTGGLLLERRNRDTGFRAGVYVAPDGSLIDAESVSLNDQNFRSRIWQPPSPEVGRQAAAVLDQMGALSLDDPRRAALKDQLKAIVTGGARPSGAAPVVPQPTTPPAPVSAGTTETVVTPRGRQITAAYEVVEADDLLTSHDDGLVVNPAYPKALQPRERSRAQSAAQVQQIAGSLRPELLGRSASATDGAPIVGPDGIVESGNARVLALRRAYQHGLPGSEAYRTWLRSQGYSIEGMKAPVLIRRRTTDLSPADREAFTREANERTTLTYSTAEQAAADARAMPEGLLDLYRGGEITAATNRDFVRRFIDSVVSPSERGAAISAAGELNQDGVRRIEAALFAKAYGDADILASLREDLDTNIKAIGAAMSDVAPMWAKLRASVAGGDVRPEMDITPDLVAAARLVSRARREGVLLSDLVNQSDMLGGSPSPQTRAVLGLMFFKDDALKRPASRQALAGSLRFYADQASRAQAGPGLDLGVQPTSPLDLLRLASGRGEGDLFGGGTAAAEMRAPSRQDSRAAAAPSPAPQGQMPQAFLKAQLDAHAPLVRSLADVRKILAQNVARGTLRADTAQDINRFLDAAPANFMQGVRLVVQRSLPRNLRLVLDLGRIEALMWSGSVQYYEDSEPVMIVYDRASAKPTIDTFIHENGHLLLDRLVTPAQRAQARRIFDGMRGRPTRHAVHNLPYGFNRDTRFEEWFAESLVDYHRRRTPGLQGRGRILAPDAFDTLIGKIYKALVDLFSGERAKIEAVIDGIYAGLRNRHEVVGPDAATSGPMLPEGTELVPDGDVLPEQGAAMQQRSPAAGRQGRLEQFLSRQGGQPQTMNAAPPWALTGPGQNYVGMRRDVFNPDQPVSSLPPIRREQILRDLVTELATALYTGRIKDKRVLGFFRPYVQEVRTRKMADIETAIHEVAHLLDNRFLEIRAQWTPASNANAAIRAELAGVSYDASKLYEGFAEFVRLWATQTPEAQARAPLFYQWWENWLSQHEYGPALRRFQQQANAWFDQDAVTRARSKIGKPPEINGGTIGLMSKFRQTVTDDLAGIMRMELDLTGQLNPAGNAFAAYETARLIRGAAGIIDGALTIGAPKVMPDGSHKFIGKSLTDILTEGQRDGSLDDMLMYWVGRSAAELMGQGREHLFTPSEIRGMLALRQQSFDQAFADYQTWNKAILDFAQAKDLIDPHMRALWKRTQYLPFHRVGTPGAFSPVPGDWRGIKALTGGTDNLRDVLTNIVQNAATLIRAAEMNGARVAVANLAQRQIGGAKFMARIPKEDVAVKIPKDEILRVILDALGVTHRSQLTPEQQAFVDEILDGMGGLVTLLQRGQPPGGRNVVAVLKAGRPEYFEVADPLLFRALMSLQRTPAHWLTRLLGIPKRIGQASITLTPDFMGANIFRDTVSGAVFSRHGFRPVIDSAAGFLHRLRGSQTYRDFLANGGGFSSYLMEEGDFRAHLARFYRGRGIDYRTILDTPRKLFFGLERVADSFEMATRLGEYSRAIKRGQHPRHAAYSAREVSTDFAMRGDSQALGFLYDTIIFLKAGVVSMDRVARGFTQDPNRGAIAAKTALIGGLSLGLYMLNRGLPEYEDLEDWDRDGHWHFFIPTPEALLAASEGRELPANGGRYWHFRLPKVWEIGAVGSLAERSFQRWAEDKPEKLISDAGRIIGNLFGFEYIPQALAPAYELAINRNRFRDAPIETMGQQQLQPFARSSYFTSPTVKAIGEATAGLPSEYQISPQKLEHLIRGYLNTWGSYGLMLSDWAFFRNEPDMRLDQYPVIRRFFAQDPARSSRWVTELYEAIDASNEVRRTAKAMAKRGDNEAAVRLAYSPENMLYAALDRADKRLSGLRKFSILVENAKDLAETRKLAEEWGRLMRQPDFAGKAQQSRAWGSIGALKRHILDGVIAERNQYAKKVVGLIEERRAQIEASPPTPPPALLESMDLEPATQ